MLRGPIVGVLVAAVIVPLVVRDFFRGARREKPAEKDGAVVFRKSKLMRYFGFAGVCLFLWPVTLFALGRGNDMTWWMAVIFSFFALGLASFCIGEVWLFENRIEKRALWLTKAIPWDNVQALVQDRGEAVVIGPNVRLKFSQYFAGSDKLITEIKKRSPQLHWMLQPPPEPRAYPWAKSE